MALCGFSMDNLSLMALTIATGFIVDDAIVMIENVVRLVEKGMRPLEAAYEGARQIGFTIVSLTVSLIAVFIPLLFMDGVVGRLFREFALVLTIAVVVSMFVSLTLTPMMCGLLLRPTEEERPGRLSRGFERGFEAVLRGYTRTLDWALRREALMLGIAALTLAGTVWLYIIAPKGFLPLQDTGLITVTVEAPQDVSFRRMQDLQRAAVEAIAQDPAVASTTSVVGAGTLNPAQNSGRISVVLKPRGEREGIEAISTRLNARLAAIPGILAYLQPVQDIQIGTRPSSTQYQYTLTDSSQAVLSEWAPRIVAALRALPNLRDVASDQREDGLRIALDVDRARAARLGVTMQEINDTLYDAFGQRQISTIYGQSNQYRVVLEVDPAQAGDPAVIGMLRVPGAASTDGNGSDQIPLAEIARISRVPGPLTVTRQNQFPAVTLSFNLTPGASLDGAITAIRDAETRIGMPDTMSGSFGGDAAEFSRSLEGQGLLILAAIVVIYIVLGMLYESVIHPITILSTLPSAGIGALLALDIFGLDLSVVGLIGIILLMGIVKKNAIMMIDFALEAQREHGMTPRQAIREACLLRFRPIMMTTLAALLGAIPLVLSHGAGSELRLPLGVSVIGGLLLSQVITLYTTPVIYLAMEWIRERAIGLVQRAPPPAPAE